MRRFVFVAGLISSLFTAGSVSATELGSPQATPYISIIIDDLGNHLQSGLRAVNLPGPLTYAILPQSSHGRRLAEAVHQSGREVMLHLPMESTENQRLGPVAITLDMSRKALSETLDRALNSIPYVIGINNHMGSLLTRHPGHMRWLMEEIKSHGQLFFIDSRTTHHTVAEQLAREIAIPVERRDVFLDNDPSTAAVAKQFQRLIKKAKKSGSAIAIGHPYENTLTFLESALPHLEARQGVRIVSIKELMHQRRSQQGVSRLVQRDRGTTTLSR